MYWPVGTPRIFATTSSQPPTFNFVVSRDGLPPSPSSEQANEKAESAGAEKSALLTASSAASQDAPQVGPTTPITPATPATPLTPRINSIELDSQSHDGSSPERIHEIVSPRLPLREPILALRVSRSGHIFAVITATSLTIWQSKPTVVLAVVVRSDTSLRSYGTNIDLLLRPDSAIVVIHTSLGYLITYSLATDSESRVYKPHFTSHTNLQRRRQNHAGGPGYNAPDQIFWGPGEGSGVRDLSVRFRMVIKVDAGIESALALDDELVVATRKPAAVQCIRWTPDSSGSQTSTELLSRMLFLGKKVTVTEMTHDRPMNLSTWVTSDGRACAVQRVSQNQQQQQNESAEVPDPKKLFKGHCFHIPQSEDGYAARCVINARFSLIAVGCADGSIHVYAAKDYSGNIPPSHVHKLPVSKGEAGKLMALSYSPDGYCLFTGFEKGWATWSVFGKLLSSSFGADRNLAATNGEEWITGVLDAAWIGGGCELLLVSREHEAVWVIEMGRSAVTGCYSSANLFRTVVQTATSVIIYRGYDLPDLTSISAEPFLWHTAKIPAAYLMTQWPIRCTVVSSDGRYVAVAGKRGLAHYSINSGRWKTFSNEATENDFSVRGGMCWYQNILVAAVESNRSYELRLYSRETALDMSTVLHSQPMPAPVVLITPSGEDSLLVYTYENLLYHFIFAPFGGSIKLVQVGELGFHGIVRSPARVRGLSWILPEGQLIDGDPSQDVTYASILFLVDGKLVLLQPSLNEDGHLKYDMRVVAQNVEFYVSMRDQPFLGALSQPYSQLALGAGEENLRNSLWMFDGGELKVWTDLEAVMKATSGELPPTIPISVDFYPLSVLLGKAIVLGVETDLVQRRDVSFSFFRFSIRTHLFLPEILRSHLNSNKSVAALRLAHQYQHLEYFAHALEILLHHVLDEEVDASPPPAPENAILPRVLSLLSSFKQYLDIVVQCTRKTEVRSWRTLFAYLPPPQELFEESLQRGSLKTAGGYLLILHTFDELATASEQSVRLLSRAMREEDWELCKELARFLAALDDTGGTLREALAMVNVRMGQDAINAALLAPGDNNGLVTRLEVPQRRLNGSPSSSTLGPSSRRNVGSDSDVDTRSTSDAGSMTSGGRSEGTT